MLEAPTSGHDWLLQKLQLIVFKVHLHFTVRSMDLKSLVS